MALRWRRSEALMALADARPQFEGGHSVRLLRGGDELFPAMCAAIDAAQQEVWLATYIFHDDLAAQAVAQALARAGQRGVRVGVVVDGFGSLRALEKLRLWMPLPEVELSVFRPVGRWWSVFQPGQLRRLHQKLCVVDGQVGFVGGINLIDDRIDLRHGPTDEPRLDFAIEVRGPVVAAITQATRAVWSRAALGAEWREEARALVRSRRPITQARGLLRRLRMSPAPEAGGADVPGDPTPVQLAFVVRDNLRRRRAIEQAYVRAITTSQWRVDLICPYFYPGRRFRRALVGAARRGVRVRLLLQGKVDYRLAAMAAQALYDELLSQGVQIYEYTPAYLHAKIGLVDGDWATVGSSNIDPLSLLVNLEANVIVRDAGFSDQLSNIFDEALAVSRQVLGAAPGGGILALLRRGFVAWVANVFLRLAGITGRY